MDQVLRQVPSSGAHSVPFLTRLRARPRAVRPRQLHLAFLRRGEGQAHPGASGGNPQQGGSLRGGQGAPNVACRLARLDASSWHGRLFSNKEDTLHAVLARDLDLQLYRLTSPWQRVGTRYPPTWGHIPVRQPAAASSWSVALICAGVNPEGARLPRRGVQQIRADSQDCLLKRGAASVLSVDIEGYARFDWSLRGACPRVTAQADQRREPAR